MSNIDKQALRERYSAKPTPKCDICGAKMTIQRMSGSRVTYGCSGAIYDETGCHYAEGRSLADDHYEQSRVTVTDESDPDVLALLDELEAKDNRINRLESIVAVAEQRNAMMREWKRALKVPCDLVDNQVPVVIHGMVIRLERLKEAEAKLEAAEKRIAELEALTVTLPENITSANAPEVFEISAEAERLGLRGTYASYAVGWNARGIADKEALREAGVKVAAAGKGE